MRDASSELLAKLAEGTDFSESRVGCVCVLVRVSGWSHRHLRGMGGVINEAKGLGFRAAITVTSQCLSF